MAGIGESWETAINGNEPHPRSILVPTDPAIFSRTNKRTGLLHDYDLTKRLWDKGLADWQSAFATQLPDFEARIGRSNAFLDWINNGGFEDWQASNRNAFKVAYDTGRKNSLDFANNIGEFGRVYRGDKGESSADRAFRLKASDRIEGEYAGLLPGLERSDKASEINLKLATQNEALKNLQLILDHKLDPARLSTAALRELNTTLASIGQTRAGASDKVAYNASSALADVLGTGDAVVDTAGGLLSAYGGGGYKGSTSASSAQPTRTSSSSYSSSVMSPAESSQDRQWMNEFNGSPSGVGGGVDGGVDADGPSWQQYFNLA